MARRAFGMKVRYDDDIQNLAKQDVETIMRHHTIGGLMEVIYEDRGAKICTPPIDFDGEKFTRQPFPLTPADITCVELEKLFDLFKATEEGKKLLPDEKIEPVQPRKLYELIKPYFFDAFQKMFSVPVPDDKAVYYIFHSRDTVCFIRRKTLTGDYAETLESSYLIDMHSTNLPYVNTMVKMVITREY